MPRLNQIQRNDSRHVRIDFGEAGDLNVEVYPSRFTLGYQRRVHDAVRDSDVARMADLFFENVASWDLLDDDGTPLPLNGETVDRLGLDTFTRILTEVMDAIAPKRTT